ncbi:MAG: hypothetical protein MHPSP_003655, partial [Paramarteilia canceri]
MDEVNDAEVPKGICPEPNYNVFVSKFYIKVVASSPAEPKIRQITLSRKLGIPVNSQIESEN